jgi:hypothetical protein
MKLLPQPYEDLSRISPRISIQPLNIAFVKCLWDLPALKALRGMGEVMGFYSGNGRVRVPHCCLTVFDKSCQFCNDIKRRGFMGFIRRGEEHLAIRYLEWHYRKMNLEKPAPSKLQGQAKKIVDEAHRIARETGGNVISIIKEIIDDLRGGNSP